MPTIRSPLEIANELREKASLGKILKAISSTHSSTFTQILNQTHVSSRTLAKHLDSLVHRGFVERRDAQYRVTDEGLEYARALEDQQEKVNEYRRIAAPKAKHLVRDYAVEVTAIGPFSKSHCLGIFNVTRERALEVNERQQMDKVLTEAMRMIAKDIPAGSKEFGVRITGILL
ncbi:MAG: winged helix-turn-helix domain-containing protein [Candidatus Bathyarchaeia archaeon]